MKAPSVVALAGGVGGARMAHGLYQALPADHLTVIVNTGDDFSYYGMYICPDLDTVCYTLGGLACQETGWGMEHDSFGAMAQVKSLGEDDWFHLGDRDIGTQLARTSRLKSGESLSSITMDFCTRLNIQAKVIPMTDASVSTKVITTDGSVLDFQEYFVHQHCQPEVRNFFFDGVAQACPAPGVIDDIVNADLVIICPSNPLVSINPILAVPGIKAALKMKTIVAISPLIGGKAIKGPLEKMYRELEIEPTCHSIANHYLDLIRGFMIDHTDSHWTRDLSALGIIVKTADILMRDEQDRKRLAIEVLDFAHSIARKK